MLRKFTLPVAGLILAGLLAGCGGSPTVPPRAAAGHAPVEGQDLPNIPADAQWTLLCYIVTGADHVVQSRRMRNDLLRSTDLRDWYVVHGETESTLYYGFYREITDPRDRETARARRDRERVQAFTDMRGDRVFRMAQFVALDLPGQDGPPEWDIRNAEGFWSLEIATYRDSTERRRVAVEAVRAARQMGVEAYYFHGPNASSVLIGAWPKEAVRSQDAAVAETRHSPSTSIAIVPPGMEPPAGARDVQGNPIQVFVPRVEPVDPKLIATMREYPHYAVNGEEVVRRSRDPRTGEFRVVHQPSALVQIPRRQRTMLSGSGAPFGVAADGATTTQPPPPAPTAVPLRPAPTGGRLRSFDE